MGFVFEGEKGTKPWILKEDISWGVTHLHAFPWKHTDLLPCCQVLFLLHPPLAWFCLSGHHGQAQRWLLAGTLLPDVF